MKMREANLQHYTDYATLILFYCELHRTYKDPCVCNTCCEIRKYTDNLAIEQSNRVPIYDKKAALDTLPMNTAIEYVKKLKEYYNKKKNG